MDSSFVLVILGYYNKYHRFGGLNNRNVFLTVLETEKSKIKVPADAVLDENPLPGLQTAIVSFYPHMAETVSPLSLLIRILFSSWGLQPHDFI